MALGLNMPSFCVAHKLRLFLKNLKRCFKKNSKEEKDVS